MALWIGAASMGLAPVFGAPDEGPFQHILQFRGQVVVGSDGNGVLADQFATTADGPDVRYVLYIDDALGTGGATPSQVRGLTITLNDDVVFQSDEAVHPPVRMQVALNAAGGELNSIVLAARGNPHQAARVSVLAVRPAPVAFGGRSVFPSAMIGPQTRTALTMHNVGAAPLAFRILFFRPDGSLAGRTGPRVLPALATDSLDLGELAGSSNIEWSRGAVHVRWASHGFTRVSAVATYHREPGESGNSEASVLALDDYGPFMVNGAELKDIFGE